MPFVAGGYKATWAPGTQTGAAAAAGTSLGQTAQGYRLSHQFFKRIITGDGMAQSPQDAVYQGAEMHLQFNLIEYSFAAVRTLMWPYGAYAATIAMGVVGRLDVQQNLTGAVVLTAVAGTTAAAALAPATLTLPICMLSEGFPVELLMAPDLKEVPIRLRVYPNTTAGATFGVFGTQT